MAEEERSTEGTEGGSKKTSKKKEWMIVGIAAVGVGIIWYFFLRPKTSSTSSSIPSGTVTPTVTGTGYAGQSNYPSGSSTPKIIFLSPNSSNTESTGTTSTSSTSTTSSQTGAQNQQSGSQQGANTQAQQNSYNAYINGLLSSGQEPQNIGLGGTAYRNFGISPLNPNDYIFGKYVKGHFVTSYEQPISQTGSNATAINSTVGGVS